MDKRDATEDGDDIELSFQELLQSSPYICIAVGALSACLTFAVIISMYTPAEYSDNPNNKSLEMATNKRKILIERATQTELVHPPGTDVISRDLCSSYRPLREHEAAVHNREGIKEYFSSELSPFKLKIDREPDIRYTDMLHTFCGYLPDPVLQHKREPSTSLTRSDTEVTIKSLRGVLNRQSYTYLPSKRLPQDYFTQAGNIKRPVQMTKGKHQMVHTTRTPYKQKQCKQFDCNLTQTALTKSQNWRATSRRSSDRPDVIPPRKRVISSQGQSARRLSCHGEYKHSFYPGNYGEDVSKRKYLLYKNNDDGKERKYQYSTWNNKTSYSCQKRLPTGNGASNRDENCGLFYDSSTRGTSCEKDATFCGQTLTSGDNISLASSSNVCTRLVDSQVWSKEQSDPSSRNDEDTDQDIVTLCCANQQSNYKSHGLTTRHNMQKDKALQRQKATKGGMHQSTPSPALQGLHRKKEQTSITDNKTRHTKNYGKHKCSNKISSMISDAIGRSNQFGNSANALLSTSPGEIVENTWSSVAGTWKQTREGSAKQRITYRQCSAARESQKNVPTFTLNAVRREHGKTNRNPIEESGIRIKERQIKGGLKKSPSIRTQAVNKRLVSLGNCSSELRSLMRATIMDLQKYKSSWLSATNEHLLFEEERLLGTPVAVEELYSRTQPRIRRFGRLRGSYNSNSHLQNMYAFRDSSSTNKFRKRHQITEHSGEPPLSDKKRSLVAQAGVEQTFSKTEPRSRLFGNQRGKDNSNSHQILTSIKNSPLSVKKCLFERRAGIEKPRNKGVRSQREGDNSKYQPRKLNVCLDSSYMSKFSKHCKVPENSNKQALKTTAEAVTIVTPTAVLSQRHGQQIMGDVEDIEKGFSTEQCFAMSSFSSCLFESNIPKDTIALTKETVFGTRSSTNKVAVRCRRENRSRCPGNYCTNINCKGQDSHDLILGEVQFPLTKNSFMIKRSVGPISSNIYRETFGKLNNSKLNKLRPINCKLRSEKSYKPQNCDPLTVTRNFKKHGEVLAPGKKIVNNKWQIMQNKLLHGNVSTDKLFHGDEETDRHADSVGVSQKCQHGFNVARVSKQSEVKRCSGQKINDRGDKIYKQTYQGQENNQPTLCNNENEDDDVLHEGCMPYLSDMSLMTNNSAECADFDKQVPSKSSFKNYSEGRSGSDSICSKKERRTQMDSATTHLHSVIDSLSITHSSEILRDFTSSKLGDKTNESSSKKEETYTITLSTDISTLGGQGNTDVETCSVAGDDCLNMKVHSTVTPLTRSEVQTDNLQNNKVKFEMDDRNLSHKGKYELGDISQSVWQRKHRQHKNNRRKELHKKKIQNGDKGNYELWLDDAENCYFNNRRAFHENQYQNVSTTGCSPRGNDSYHDIFVNRKHHRHTVGTHLTSKKCNDAGHENNSELVFHTSAADTSSEYSRTSNSLTRQTNYGAHTSSSSQSRSLSRSLYLAQLLTDSSSLGPSASTYSLQDSLCRHGCKLLASRSIVTVCSSIESRTETPRCTINISGDKRNGKLALGRQFDDMPASSIHDILNVGTLHYRPIEQIDYEKTTNWSDTRTTISNNGSVTGLSQSELSICMESTTPHSVSVENATNILPNLESRKETGFGGRALKPVCKRYHGEMMMSRKHENSYERQLPDSCNREHIYGAVPSSDSNDEHSYQAAQLPYRYSDEYSYETIHSPDSCTAENSNEMMQSPIIISAKRNCGKMQPLTNSRLGVISGLEKSLDSWSLDDDSGAVRSPDSSNPDHSSEAVQAQDRLHPRHGCESVQSPGSSDSEHCSRTVQTSINSNPEKSSETAQTLYSSNPKDNSRRVRALASTNSPKTYGSVHTPCSSLHQHWKQESKGHQRQTTHGRQRVATAISPPSIPLDVERVTYMQIVSKNGASKGFRLSELDQRPLPSILKKSRSKSVVIKHVGDDSVLTFARQPVSSSVSQLACVQPSMVSKSNASGSSVSCMSNSEHSGRARSRLGRGDNHCKQDVLAQPLSHRRVPDSELGPETQGNPCGIKDFIKSKAYKHFPKKSFSHGRSRDRTNPRDYAINKSNDIDFVTTSKYRKKITENKIRNDNLTSVEPVYKMSSPDKAVKKNIPTKQAFHPRGKKNSDIPLVCSKNTIIDNRRRSKYQVGEKIRQTTFKSMKYNQNVTSTMNKCHTITTNNKRGKCDTCISCKPVDIEGLTAHNEGDTLNNVDTRNLLSKYGSTCNVCLPLSYKCMCDCQHTSRPVTLCPRNKKLHTQSNSQKPRCPKYLQNRKQKQEEYNDEEYVDEHSQIGIHHAPEDYDGEPYNTENTRAGKNSRAKAFNHESFTTKNNQISIHCKPNPCDSESSTAGNTHIKTRGDTEAHKDTSYSTENTEGVKNRKLDVRNCDSYTTESSEISIHSKPNAHNSKSFSTESSEISIHGKPKVYEDESRHAEQKQVGKKKQKNSAVCNGDCYYTENTKSSRYRKPETINGQSCATKDNQFNIYRKPEELICDSCITKNKQVGNNYKLKAHNGDSYTTENTKTSMKSKPEKSKDDSYNKKNSQVIGTHVRCHGNVTKSRYENLRGLGTPVNRKSVGKIKERAQLTNTPSPKEQKCSNVSTIKKVKKRMVQNQRNLNILEHRTNFGYRKHAKSQVESANTFKFSNIPTSPDLKKSTQRKIVAGLNKQSSEIKVQCADKRRKSQIVPCWQVDQFADVIVASRDLNQQGQRGRLQEVKQPALSENQQISTKYKRGGLTQRSDTSEQLKSTVQTTVKMSSACPLIASREEALGRDMSKPAGHYAVPIIAQPGRSSNVSHGLLYSKGRANADNTIEGIRQRPSSLNSLMKNNDHRDFNKILRQGGLGNTGEIRSRKLSGSNVACPVGISKHLIGKQQKPKPHISSACNHDKSHQLSDVSISHGVHKTVRPIRIRKLLKVTPGVNLNTKTSLSDSPLTPRITDFRQHPGYVSPMSGNTMCKIPGNLHNWTPHVDKDIQFIEKGCSQERNRKRFCSNKSPNLRHQRHDCISKIVHKHGEGLLSLNSATRQPHRQESIKHVQFGNNNRGVRNTANKRRTSNYGHFSRKQEKEMANCLRKGSNNCKNCEILQSQPDVIDGVLLPDCTFTRWSGSQRQQDLAGENTSGPQSNNVPNGYVEVTKQSTNSALQDSMEQKEKTRRNNMERLHHSLYQRTKQQTNQTTGKVNRETEELNGRKCEQIEPELRSSRQSGEWEIRSKRKYGQEKKPVLTDGYVSGKEISRQQIHPADQIPEGKVHATNKYRFGHPQIHSKLSREDETEQGSSLFEELIKTPGNQSFDRIISEDEQGSAVIQLDFTKMPCDTTPRAKSYQKCTNSSEIERPHLQFDEFQEKSLNNSSRNLYFMTNHLDFNNDFNIENSSLFPSTADEVSASAIFDKISQTSEMCKLSVGVPEEIE